MIGSRTTKSRTAFYREAGHPRPFSEHAAACSPGAALRGQFYNPWAEGLGPVIIAIQRKPRIAGEGHRVSNQLCATGARICSAGVTHGACGQINRATQILSCPAVECKCSPYGHATIAEYHDP